jgi:hypothetical protein
MTDVDDRPSWKFNHGPSTTALLIGLIPGSLTLTVSCPERRLPERREISWRLCRLSVLDPETALGAGKCRVIRKSEVKKC